MIRITRVAVAVVIFGCILASGALVPAAAFQTSPAWSSTDPGFTGNLSYERRSQTFTTGSGNTVTATPPSTVTDLADAAWERFGNTRSLTRVSSSSNWIGYASNLAMGGDPASATAPCRGTNCRVRINYELPWNNSTACAGSPLYDLRSSVTHEFGHWYGAGHADDRPSSGRNRRATMDPGSGSNYTDCSRSDVEQDDMNIVLHGEPSVSNIASNNGIEDSHSTSSFSNGDLHWRLLPSTGGTGNAARYYDPTSAYEGSFLAQFNNGSSGSAASIYQDIFPRGAGVTSVTPNVRLRNDSSGTQLYKMIVWDMAAAGGPAPLVKDCNIPAGGWYYCFASFAVNSDHLRLQIYNYSSGNVSIDNFRINAND